MSEELLRVSVLDDAAVAVVAHGCRKLKELELVQVGGRGREGWGGRNGRKGWGGRGEG